MSDSLNESTEHECDLCGEPGAVLTGFDDHDAMLCANQAACEFRYRNQQEAETVQTVEGPHNYG